MQPICHKHTKHLQTTHEATTLCVHITTAVQAFGSDRQFPVPWNSHKMRSYNDYYNPSPVCNNICSVHLGAPLIAITAFSGYGHHR